MQLLRILPYFTPCVGTGTLYRSFFWESLVSASVKRILVLEKWPNSSNTFFAHGSEVKTEYIILGA